MRLIQSLKKSWKLKKLSKTLGAMKPYNSAESLLAGGARKDQALAQLFTLCESDPQVRAVMDDHSVNRKTLMDLYSFLLRTGAASWERGHYVPASTLVFAFTLKFLLENKDKRAFQEIALRLMDYFAAGQVGPCTWENWTQK